MTVRRRTAEDEAHDRHDEEGGDRESVNAGSGSPVLRRQSPSRRGRAHQAVVSAHGGCPSTPRIRERHEQEAGGHADGRLAERRGDEDGERQHPRHEQRVDGPGDDDEGRAEGGPGSGEEDRREIEVAPDDVPADPARWRGGAMDTRLGGSTCTSPVP